jgi:hypothetical protein
MRFEVFSCVAEDSSLLGCDTLPLGKRFLISLRTVGPSYLRWALQDPEDDPGDEDTLIFLIE